MKNTRSKIRFMETFVIATFPLALAVGCSATGDPKPSDLSMQEDVSVQQQASINSDELNTLTFTETESTPSTDGFSNQESVLHTSANSEDLQEDSEAVGNQESLDSESVVQASNVTDEAAVSAVNLQTPEQTKMQEPDSMILHFAVNKFDISEQDITALQKHAEYLRANPGIRININGYSDSRGSAKLNFELSKKRAQQVANVLINSGVPESQIKVNSYGESFPLHDEKNWDENRRVELQYSQPSPDDGLMASAAMH